jgi:chemotaxis protein CheX
MSEQITDLISSAAEEFTAPENVKRLDTTVIEIFDMMFGLAIAADVDGTPFQATSELDIRTAIVGFSGSMRGSCQVRAGKVAAESIASAMLGGASLDGDDESINDALGELCNMLAGSWKNGIPDLSSGCSLSPPTIIAGVAYKIQMSKPSSRLCRVYRFGEHELDLTLFREESTA